MKRLLWLVVSASVLSTLLLAACGEREEPAKVERAPSAQQAAQDPIHHPLDAHLSDAYTDDLPGLLKKKYLRVLTTMNRTNFFLADGKAHGFEYALLREYEKHLNQGIPRRELQVTLQLIPVSRERLLTHLVNGYGDIAAAGLTVTEKRREIVAFTRPYLSDIRELLVTHKDVTPPDTVKELSGKEIFVRKSSSYYESLTALNRRLENEQMRPVKIVPADENLETEDILELINTGAIKRTVCDSHIAELWADVLHDIRVREGIVLRRGGKIAWAVRKNNPKLKQSLDRFLEDHKEGTLLGNIFFKRYYEKKKWIKDPLAGNAGKKIEAYRPYFEKYGQRYGFDWRLILAMAFQESGLNPKKTSRRGALGLMQIRPSTAADPNVGIKNIDTPENNIHAAVKYLDFLRDRYFSDEDIRPRDRVRFSLAAYNAGPAKIRRARKKAADMELDADRWFRNAELAVLRIVGQETVQYVSNINKYYVIYKNALGTTEAREKTKEALQ
jgi:membrane-bound lytic murein transglycosylase MltF